MAPKRAPEIPSESAQPSTSGLSLGARFSRLQNPSVAFTPEEVQAMPLEQLGETKILFGFGKAMKGRTFADAYANALDPGSHGNQHQDEASPRRFPRKGGSHGQSCLKEPTPATS